MNWKYTSHNWNLTVLPRCYLIFSTVCLSKFFFEMLGKHSFVFFLVFPVSVKNCLPCPCSFQCGLKPSMTYCYCFGVTSFSHKFIADETIDKLSLQFLFHLEYRLRSLMLGSKPFVYQTINPKPCLYEKYEISLSKVFLKSRDSENI